MDVARSGADKEEDWGRIAAESGREFARVARGFWLIPEIIPPADREAVALLYCFCRRLDDAVDEARDAPAAALALDRFRAEIAGRAPRRPLVGAFLEMAVRRRLPLECIGALLDGMESDLGTVRVPSDAALLLYAYRVSAAVGLLLAPLLGVRGPDAEARIVDLGLALQITNVVLGVGEDAGRGRAYLPGARLALVGLSHEDLLRTPGDPAIRPVLRGLASLADRYYDSALLGAGSVPLRYRHGVLLLARAYRDLGWRAARGERAFKFPAQLPLGALAWRLADLGLIALRPRVLGILPPPPHDPSLHRALAGRRGAEAPSTTAIPRRADAPNP